MVCSFFPTETKELKKRTFVHMLSQNEQSDMSLTLFCFLFRLFFFFFYNHVMSSKHHVDVQYVLQYCNNYRSTF